VAVDRLLSGDPPPPGGVLAPNLALCESCPRRSSRPERLEVHALRRLATTALDPERCFLAQGLVCLGPGTRQGCQPGCLEAGMPCRGCFGPLDGVRDGGAAMLSAFASLLGGGEDEVRALAEALPDPAGTFWRYSYAAALLPGRVRPARREGP
jgi:F420-non-reducing hydrogenase small subunit